MNSFKAPNTIEQLNTVLINRYMSVQAAAEVTGYSAQYLRRILRAGILKGCKIGQMWLIELDGLAVYLEQAHQEPDRRHGPRGKNESAH